MSQFLRHLAGRMTGQSFMRTMCVTGLIKCILSNTLKFWFAQVACNPILSLQPNKSLNQLD